MGILCLLLESIQFMVNLAALDKKYHEYEAQVIRFKNKEFFVIKWLGYYSTKTITNLYVWPNRVSKHISKKYKDKKLTKLKGNRQTYKLEISTLLYLCLIEQR